MNVIASQFVEKKKQKKFLFCLYRRGQGRRLRLWLCDWNSAQNFTIFSPSLFLGFYCLKQINVLICIKKGRGPEMNTIKCILNSVSDTKCLLSLTQILHNLWREIQTTQLMKCPLNFDCTTRQKHSGNPNLKQGTSWLLPKSSRQELMLHFWNKTNEVLYSWTQILWKICFRWSVRKI